ncbi:MAG TPA: glycine zipper 2TM domain-containing protein [Gemmatimonadales bacterium]|nr:glycine zipper 2TM domain-containing protein [Gemmatimonadales bacterium]
MTRLAIFATAIAVGLGACQKGQDQSQASDSTARNLTLAPAESTGQMRDVADQRTTPPPATRNPTNRTNPPPAPPRPPAPPPLARLGVGTKMDIAASDTISSRTAKVGDAFTARVVEDVRNASGRVVIPAGSVVNGKITDVKPSPNPSTPGTLTLSVSSITVRGKSYPIEASVDSLETIHKGRGITSGDAAKVGAGAAAGAILGRVLGGNKKGTIIGGVVGAAAGAGVAHQTKDSDIVLPAGAHIIIRLTKELAVSAS